MLFSCFPETSGSIDVYPAQVQAVYIDSTEEAADKEKGMKLEPGVSIKVRDCLSIGVTTYIADIPDRTRPKLSLLTR